MAVQKEFEQKSGELGCLKGSGFKKKKKKKRD